MATNKHATIRYHELDRCFSNHGRRYFMDDLVEACNEAIYEYTGSNEGVKKRQIFDDIKFMESDQGWSIPLNKIRDGKKVYYRYAEKSFSISSKGINPSEAEQLNETLSILKRFKGMPQFDWIEEIQVRLEDTFQLKGNKESIVAFEENPYLKGLDKFTLLFNAIQNQQSLQIEYQGFKQQQSSSFVFHSWYLKQYNNRWFIFGSREGYSTITNLAIDRIKSIDHSSQEYVPNKDTDFEEFFEDIVGVSVDPLKKTEKVRVKISSSIWPYVESKPLHGSQKVKSKSESYTVVELDVQVNYELISLLFSYMDGVEVIKPTALRERFQTISESLFNTYN